MASAPNGRTVVAGERSLAVYLRDGRLDSHFADHGKLSLPLLSGALPTIEDIAVDTEGRVAIAGTARQPTGGAAAMIVRFLPNGALDPSFGGSGHGILLTDFGLPAIQGPPGVGDPPAPAQVTARSIAIDSLGRIVIAGGAVAFMGYCRSAGYQRHHHIYLARLTPDGALDSDFGQDGWVVNDQQAWMGGMILTQTGKPTYITDQNDAISCEGFGGGLMVRLRGNGGPDLTFGANGQQSVSPEESRPRQIAIDRDGRILVLRDATSSETKHGPDFQVLSRWNADGSFDSGFGTKRGMSVLKLPGGESSLNALTVDLRGRPLLAGKTTSARTAYEVEHRIFPRTRFVLVRLRTSGRLDRRFGEGGRVATRFGRGSKAVATDLLISGKNRVLAAGPVVGEAIAGRRGFALARFKLNP